MAFSRADIERVISEKIFALTFKKISDPNEELVATGILNSVTLAELAVELERALGISFSFMEIGKENFSTPARICTLVEQKTLNAL